MHLALPSVIGTLLGGGLTAALAWDWWRHPMEQLQRQESRERSGR